jgi:hypothetical protein
MAMKCKEVGAVRAIPAAGIGGEPPGRSRIVKVANVECRNFPNYPGPAYILQRRRNDGTYDNGMQILPDLAVELTRQLEAASKIGPTVMLQNHSGGNWQDFRRFTNEAAVALAASFRAAG